MSEQALLLAPLNTLPPDGRAICFDFETTGFGFEDEIVEIGAVEVVDGLRTGVIFQSYMRPNCAS